VASSPATAAPARRLPRSPTWPPSGASGGLRWWRTTGGGSRRRRRAVRLRDLADRAAGYGMAGVIVDGQRRPAVVAAVREAADRGRRATDRLIEPDLPDAAPTRRPRAPTTCRPTSWPVGAARSRLLRFESVLDGGASPAGSGRRCGEIGRRGRRRGGGGAGRPPSPTRRGSGRGEVFSPPTADAQSADADRPLLRIPDAISDGLREGMRPTNGWCCSARTSPSTAAPSRSREVVAEFGGSGLATRRSSSRGRWAAARLASTASTPWWKMQFATSSAAASTRSSQSGHTHYRWGRRCRSSSGAGRRRRARPVPRPEHQVTSPTCPGLRICPATRRRQGLLLAAFDDPNRAVLEHKACTGPSGRCRPVGTPWASEGPAGPAGRTSRRDPTDRVRWALEPPGSWPTTAPATSRSSTCGRAAWTAATVLASVERTGRALSSTRPPRRRSPARCRRHRSRPSATSTPPSCGSQHRHAVPFSRRLEVCTPPGPPLPALRSLPGLLTTNSMQARRGFDTR